MSHTILPYKYESKSGELKELIFVIPNEFLLETNQMFFGVNISELLADLKDDK